MKDLNTMDSFNKGFKIERDGKIITLTPEEMSDFRYLDKACDGRNMLSFWEDMTEDAKERELVKQMQEDETICFNLEDDYLDIVFNETGQLEQDVIRDYIKRNMND